MSSLEYRLPKAMQETHHIIGEITTEDMELFAATISTWTQFANVQIVQQEYPGMTFYVVAPNKPQEPIVIPTPVPAPADG